MTRRASYSPSGSPSYSPSDLSWRFKVAGGGGGGWTPASLPGIVDYGVWSDLTRLYQTSLGPDDPSPQPVTSAGDPIGYWMGQLDVMAYTQATAGQRPVLGASFVDWTGGGTNRSMNSVTQFELNNSFTLANYLPSCSGSANQTNVRLFGTSSEWSNSRTTTLHRGASTSKDTSAGGIVIFTGTPTTAKLWLNGVDLGAITAGTGTATSTINRIGSGGNSGTHTMKGWVICAGAGADIDATEEALLRAWFESL